MREAPPWYEEYTDGNNRDVKLDIAVGAQIDMTAASDAVLVDTGKMPHSVPSQIWDGNVAYNRYALFARGGWETAPARTIVAPDGQTSPQAGVVSDVISDENRIIDWEMNIEFTREHKSGLTMYFQDDMIPEDFDIVVDDAIVQSHGGGGTLPPSVSYIVWSVSGGVLSITTAFIGSRAVIPDYEEGGAPWYDQRDTITALNIYGLVLGIGINAFYGLTKLKDVFSFGNSCYISSGAFKGCTSLEEITIGRFVGEIFGHAFDGCLNLRNIVIQGKPQVYAGAFSLGTYEKIVECVMSGFDVYNEIGNRYTKIWQDALGSATGYDIFDGCFRIFGPGEFTPPVFQTGWMFEEMLIFPRVTVVNSASGWNSKVISSVYLGENLDSFLLSLRSSQIRSLRNGLTRPRMYGTDTFQSNSGMVGGVNLASIPGTGAGPIRTFFGCSMLTDVIISFPPITTANDGYRVGQMFEGASRISSITGVNCVDNVLYGLAAGTSAYLFARVGDLKFREGTTLILCGEGPTANPIYQVYPVNYGTLDIPSTITAYSYIAGEADTIIHRGNRNYIHSYINCRRLYCTFLGTDTATTSANTRKSGDMKLEILDLVGGSASTNQINQYFIVNCPNVKEVRIRAAVNTTNCRLDFLNNVAPQKTFNCYTTSGTPYNSATNTRFVRVGAPPPMEVS